ncbi:hypothetical protein PPL_06007 [Heterostelium album PN500]|uniref:Uncharacterized protein n=1 Tax=Heterostelium pallidum (strain ATCC 26659 / Pp 5 / PN500) TaxID=670386 RepID=D3BBY7_HETP5|nr:hypothetical protein PPL_06007 [Heterostelium album PN500]EFA81170.1 hypothetical protein PPL_06007 [Heterostelium album PN500]|eukprot:XP_020433288.1 hypothetical protein PPL_06007 [Heterostelium album PN500]
MKTPGILSKLMMKAIEQKNVEMVEFMINRYSPPIKNLDALLKTTLKTGNVQIFNMIKQYIQLPPSKIYKILKYFSDVEFVKQMFEAEVTSIHINKYISQLVKCSYKDVKWCHIDILRYLIDRSETGYTFQPDVECILSHREVNPFQFEPDQLPYYHLAMMAYYTESPDMVFVAKQVVSFKNCLFLEYIIDSNFLVENGSLEMVMKFRKHQQPTTHIYSLSATESLEILAFVRNNGQVSMEYNAYRELIYRHDHRTVLYIHDEEIMPLFFLQSYLINIDLFIGIVQRTNDDYTINSFSWGIQHFGRLFQAGFRDYFDRDDTMIKLIKNRQKSDFELAAKSFKRLVDPLEFLEIGDLEWMDEMLEKKLCLSQTKDSLRFSFLLYEYFGSEIAHSKYNRLFVS